MITSIETAIKHIEYKAELYGGKLTATEVLQILNAIKRFEENGQVMVGCGYRRYDGVEFKDTPGDKMYEGGFAVVDKNNTGIKEVALPMIKAKNDFVKWLKKNGATAINEFEGKKDPSWNYYRQITAFTEKQGYCYAVFMCYDSEQYIDCDIKGGSRYNLYIEEFLKLLE